MAVDLPGVTAVGSQHGLVSPARTRLFEALATPGETRAVLDENPKDFMRDDPVPEIVGVNAVVMDEPFCIAIGMPDIAKQAAFFYSKFADQVVKLQVGFRSSLTKFLPFELRSANDEIGSEEDDERVAPLSNVFDYVTQFVPEEIEGRAPACVVEPICNDEEIRGVCDHMLVKALVRRWFS